MKKLQKLKYIIIAVGIILSTAFYVLGGSFTAALSGDDTLLLGGEADNDSRSADDARAENNSDSGTGIGAVFGKLGNTDRLSTTADSDVSSVSGSDAGSQEDSAFKLLSRSYAAHLADELYIDADGRGYLSDALKAELKTYIREAVREELVAICEEGYLEQAVSEAADMAAAENERKKGLININTADAAGLQSLDGIGAKRAADIIAYRDAHGAFGSIEEIMQVSGIKQSSYDKIKDKICT